MSIQIFGISHKTAPIDVRERIAIDPERLPGALQGLTEPEHVNEALILSTCNRTELYCEIDHSSIAETRPDASSNWPIDWLVDYHQLDRNLVDSHCYTLQHEGAIKHALKVACGLDSMVLGEPQILGQLKQAYRVATGVGTAGKRLHGLFQFSFSVAKQIRHETSIGENPVSVAYAAAKLAQQIHGELTSKSALLIGAGETISLVANHLRSNGISKLFIANRTFSRAKDLAQQVAGEPISFEDIPLRLADADVVVSSTASRAAVISRKAIEVAVEARAGEAMFIVDLAVPRDVEPSVSELPDVYLYSVDDLNHVVSENAKSRLAAAQQAEAMIDLHVQNFANNIDNDRRKNTIIDIRSNADDIKVAAVEQATRRLLAGDDPAKVVETLANNITNRLLHQSLSEIRNATNDGDDELLEAAQRLLGRRGDPTGED